jgi:hypothetical protein
MIRCSGSAAIDPRVSLLEEANLDERAAAVEAATKRARVRRRRLTTAWRHAKNESLIEGVYSLRT